MNNRCPGCMAPRRPEPKCPHCGWEEGRQNAPHQLPVGTLLHGTYLVGRVLGQGGFGITYLGWDQEQGRRVAIKEYFPMNQVNRSQGTVMVATDEGIFQEGKDRFLKEAQALAKLRHLSHIVQVYRCFTENNSIYIAMEYIDGITLQEYIRRRGGQVPAQETLSLLRPIIRTMAQVHRSGMIHRDISPDNIMVRPDGVVKILDFGTARAMAGGQLTHSTQAILKRGFAPMEQYSAGRDIDQRADEYALCATIYYCMTGRLPPEAFDRYMDQLDIPWEQIPGLMPEQIQALRTASALAADERFPDLESLEAALYPGKGDSSPESIPPTTPADREGKAKSKGVIAAAAIALAMLLGAGGWLLLGDRQDIPEPELGMEDMQTVETTAAAETTAPEEIILPEINGYTVAAAAQTEIFGSPESGAAVLASLNPGDRVKISRMEEIEGTRWGHTLSPVEGWMKMDNAAAVAQPDVISTWRFHAVALKPDGRVSTVGDNNYGEGGVTGWSNIIAVAASYRHTVGVKQDGTVIATGGNWDGQCDVSDWKNMITVAVGLDHTVGVRKNGTAVAVGNNDYGQCDVSGWKDIVAVSAGEFHTVGLKSDGTVVAAGYNKDGSCEVSDWTDIVAIAASRNYTAGLKADGTVVAVGENYGGQREVSHLTNITGISAGSNYLIALNADGTVDVVGIGGEAMRSEFNGAVFDWKDIIEVSAGDSHVIGLKTNGSVVTGGLDGVNKDDVKDWIIPLHG